MTPSIVCARPLVLAGMFAAGLLAAAANAQPVPSGKLTVTSGFPADDDDPTNLSGAACFVKDNIRKSCVIVADEGRHARLFSIAGATMIPGDRIFLLPARDENGKKFKEADLEGVAFDAGTYYAVGSHGLSGKKGKKQPSRYFVYRLAVDPATGQPGDLGSETKASTAVERKATLDALIAAADELKSHVDNVPGEQGVNIEGLAVAGGDMFFGFRGPVLDEGALVMQVPVAAIFDGAALGAKPEVHPLPLGKGQGIRDLAAVKGGFLVLSGPEKREPGKAEVFLWKPRSAPIAIRDLGGPRRDKGQPEALLVLGETDAAYAVLVISDGPENGDPTVLEIKKP
jgi:hypothetical protein